MTYREELLQFRRKYWTDLLARCQQNVSMVARESGVNRTHLYRMIDELGIPFEKGRESRRGCHKGNWGDLTN